MLGRHYAPRTPARIFEPHQWPRVLSEHAEPAVVISHRLREIGPPHAVIPMPPTPEAYAAALYTALREADTFNASEILIERPPADGPIWFAIADRLRRATTT
jgi:L-threonylcarbamoyladenylate synthase